MLEGQVKIAFANWYNSNREYSKNLPVTLNGFRRLHLSLQFGVYVDFFDSVGIEIMTPKKSALIWSWHIRDNSIIKRINSTLIFTSANEAQSAALTKASQIFNERKT